MTMKLTLIGLHLAPTQSSVTKNYMGQVSGRALQWGGMISLHPCHGLGPMEDIKIRNC